MQDAVKRMFALALAVGLAACGGGTSPSAEQSATTSKKLTTTIALLDPAAVSTTRVDEGERLTAQVHVVETTTTTSSGQVLSTSTRSAPNAQVVVTLTGGAVTPASALTNADGIANFGVTAGGVAGAYAIEAQATLAGATGGAAALSYMVERTIQPDLVLTVLGTNGGPVSEATPGDRLTVQVLARNVRVDATGTEQQYEPASDVVVQLSADEGQFDPTEGRVTTDIEGLASVVLVPGAREGRLTVSASAQIGGKPAISTTSLYVRVPRVVFGSGDPFQPGTLQFDPPEIEAGGQSTVLGRLATEDGADFDQPVSVTLTSACAEADAATLISPVLAAGARVSSSYTATAGCSGVDTITATAQIEGQPSAVVATGQIVVRAPRPRGIAFVSADPSVIALRGRGALETPERSTVTFRVLNAVGIPVPNEPVSFALTTTIGGLHLLEAAAVTDVAGEVRAIVESGNAAVTFAVIATIPSTGESVQSEQLIVSTGGADQDSFSLSVETLNIEGFNFDGETSAITLRAADRFNNPVPDGTRLLFTTEGGSITPTCDTAGGTCSVVLTSQAPRPANGRVTLLVRTQGSESFTDANGNGAYDFGEVFEDLDEAFRDDNENGVFDAGEMFADLNGNGQHNSGNGQFDGAPCNASQCGSAIDVRRSVVVVFSTSGAVVTFNPASLSVNEVSPGQLQIRVSDGNGNLPPAGTTIEVTSDNGELLGEPSFTIGNSNARGPFVFPVSILGDDTPSVGRINVTITTPNGVVTLAQATVTDVSLCGDVQASPPPPSCGDDDVGVGSVSVSPATLVATSGATTETNVVVTVRSDESLAQPFAGAVPSVTCDAAGATGFAVTPSGSILPTASDGSTIVRLRIVAADAVAGEAQCTVRAGDATALLRVIAPGA